MKPFRLFVVPLAAVLAAASLAAQETAVPVRPAEPVTPAARPAFAFSFGSAPAADSGASCSVQATAAKGSAEKAQQLKFVLDRKGAAGPNGFTFQYFLASTGRSKSLAQVPGNVLPRASRGPRPLRPAPS